MTYQETYSKPKYKWIPPEERTPEEIATYCRMKGLSRGATRMWLCIHEDPSKFSCLRRCKLTWIDWTFGFTPKARNAALRELELVGAISRHRIDWLKRGEISLGLNTPRDFREMLRQAAEIEARKTGRAV